ncbi:MAG: hypothetical protein KIS91_05325 [Anaerolineae bacterium]|nr:hypothetical protein [Anaerolineae bacterium]
MGRIDDYRVTLRGLADWDDTLRRESGLPGPRGNLELAYAVAAVGDAALFERYRALDATVAPTNTPDEFLAFCGVLGLGRLAAEGDRSALDKLRGHAADPRWRVREAAATALQLYGDADMAGLVTLMAAWARGSRLEQRCAVAALCEPRLLRDEAVTARALAVLDGITATLVDAPDRRSEEYRVLRQALGYGWSVAVAAAPAVGLPYLDRWLTNADPNVQWVMRENLKKKRLERAAPGWVAGRR